MEPRAMASGEQFATLLEFMESHGDLDKPQPGAQGRLGADRLWSELANTLNSIGGGVTKTAEKWKKVWADWKSKTKKKALTIRRHASGTGGGPHSNLSLSVLEARVLGIVGALAVEGHAEIEQGFERPSTSAQDIQHGSQFHINIVTEDGVEPIPPISPSLPEIEIPSSSSILQNLPEILAVPSTSQQQPEAAAGCSSSRDTQRPPRGGVTTPPPIQQSGMLMSPHSFQASPHRRRRQGARCRRALTPFDRAKSEFVAIERRRLQLEEKREANDAQRIEVDRDRNIILRRFADIAEAFFQQHLQNKQ